jgi:hypothetical protein
LLRNPIIKTRIKPAISDVSPQMHATEGKK